MGGTVELHTDNQSESDPECSESTESEMAGELLKDEPTGQSWWNRQCGGREVIVLALPLMVSTFSYSVMQFCDRMFLSWHSETSLAAVMPSGVMVWTLMAFPFGLALYTNVFVAQYFGAKQYERVGVVLWHGVILAGLSTPVFILSIMAPRLVFEWAGHDPALVAHEATYFRYMSIGSIGNVISAVLTSFYIGQGRTKITMVVDVSAAALNILLDWLLIFGFSVGSLLVVEGMGIMGAAIATSIALWVKAFVYLFLIAQKPNRVKFALFDRFQFQWELIWRMLRFGSSNGIQFLVECIGIAAFAMMIARLGTMPAAASTVAININMLVFVPIFGLSMAVSTMVGQKIGSGQPDLAERASWTSLSIAVLYTTVFGASYLLFPGLYMMGFKMGAEDFEATSRLVHGLLFFVAAYCIFDSIQIVFVAAIKGAGDTNFVIYTTIVCSTLFVLVGIGGQSMFGTVRGQLFWWWAALTGWIVLLSLIYGARFLQGKWKSMKVIEHTM